VGLRVPDTLLTNSKHEMERFKQKHGRIISKTIGDACCIAAGSEAYVMFTVELTEELLNRSPEAFFPSLAQEMLEKKYEIRVFYLDGECHAMAIFSQLDSRTAVDFRHYNYSRPNREVPYRLPCEIGARIRALMEKLDLGTGSLDLVRTEGGEYVFLEINPVGQFGMVSYPCNYRLEKKVAESLIRRASRA
ncbi:MAG: grasp-with-spasm system ATP-grasp peptide maturase, partial [Holophagales bacterium]|nr:grasp-with-spasm system ATP-grasp peptide maturase [Holophagales bacterium]